MGNSKNKFNRVAADASQLQQFADEVCDKCLDAEPVSGGTKLYKHNFECAGFGGPVIDFTIINTSSTPITGEDLYNESGGILEPKDCVSYVMSSSTADFIFVIINFAGNGKKVGAILLNYNGVGELYQLSSKPTITDTVTEL